MAASVCTFTDSNKELLNQLIPGISTRFAMIYKSVSQPSFNTNDKSETFPNATKQKKTKNQQTKILGHVFKNSPNVPSSRAKCSFLKWFIVKLDHN